MATHPTLQLGVLFCCTLSVCGSLQVSSYLSTGILSNTHRCSRWLGGMLGVAGSLCIRCVVTMALSASRTY
jgi:hypothetical protein